MDRELEIGAEASAGGWLRWRPRHHTLPAGSPCPNCATALQGPYCHACGQLGEQFHRSLSHLVVEALESFFHADGRLFHTLPRLLLHPGQLTREFVQGHRASQIPPLRLFLVVVLLFFLAGSVHGHTNLVVGTPQELHNGVTLGQAVKGGRGPERKISGMERWVVPRLQYAGTHQREFSLIFESWSHRLAVALLPLMALLLSLLFAFSRRFFIFDHLIFSMHSLSMLGLLGTVETLISAIPGLGAVSGLVYLVGAWHLFVHLRGFYGTGILGTILRMLVLVFGGIVGFALLSSAVVLIGLSELETESGKQAAPAAPQVPHTASVH